MCRVNIYSFSESKLVSYTVTVHGTNLHQPTIPCSYPQLLCLPVEISWNSVLSASLSWSFVDTATQRFAVASQAQWGSCSATQVLQVAAAGESQWCKGTARISESANTTSLLASPARWTTRRSLTAWPTMKNYVLRKTDYYRRVSHKIHLFQLRIQNNIRYILILIVIFLFIFFFHKNIYLYLDHVSIKNYIYIVLYRLTVF